MTTASVRGDLELPEHALDVRPFPHDGVQRREQRQGATPRSRAKRQADAMAG